MTKQKIKPFNSLQKRVFQILVDTIKQKKGIKSLILIGDVGIGKSFASKIYAYKLAGKGLVRDVVELHFGEIDREKVREIVNEYPDDIIILIDEIREPFISQMDTKPFLILMEYLYRKDMPFILIFNSEEDLKKIDTPTLSKAKERAEIIKYTPPKDKKKYIEENPRLRRIGKRKRI